MFYIDPLYIVLVLPTVFFAMWASSRVNSTYKKYSSPEYMSNITAQDACRRVLNENGLYDVAIQRISGNLTDHFDPRENVIRLSDSVYDNKSVAAIGVACHEAGHAIQYANNYAPLTIRNAIIPATNIGSKLAVPLILAGIFFTFGGNSMIWLAYLGVACFFMSVIFQLITLPTEFDASKRAILAIENGGYLEYDEIRGSKKVLNAAALTYVAALAVSLAQFLRLLLMVASRNRD
ncbi:MAG: zinc metallopeptidase [Erysipelotrichaceae bacterium]